MPRVRRTEKAQAIAAASLASGASVTAAAVDAGVDRRTVQRWQASSPQFRAQVREARAGAVEEWRDIGAMSLRLVRLRIEAEIEATERGEPKETLRDIVGVATRALHHIEALDDALSGVKDGQQDGDLTDDDRRSAAEALRELVED